MAAESPDEVTRLSAVLDQQHEQLESISRVVGTGIGYSARGDGSLIVVQVFVESPDRVDEVQKRVVNIIGNGIPVETVFLPTPKGD